MSRTACKQSSPSRIDRPYSHKACGKSAPPLSQGVTLKARPCGDSCREPHPGFARFRPYRASIFSPLAHRGPACSAYHFATQCCV